MRCWKWKLPRWSWLQKGEKFIKQIMFLFHHTIHLILLASHLPADWVSGFGEDTYTHTHKVQKQGHPAVLHPPSGKNCQISFTKDLASFQQRMKSLFCFQLYSTPLPNPPIHTCTCTHTHFPFSLQSTTSMWYLDGVGLCYMYVDNDIKPKQCLWLPVNNTGSFLHDWESDWDWNNVELYSVSPLTLRHWQPLELYRTVCASVIPSKSFDKCWTPRLWFHDAMKITHTHFSVKLLLLSDWTKHYK